MKERKSFKIFIALKHSQTPPKNRLHSVTQDNNLTSSSVQDMEVSQFNISFSSPVFLCKQQWEFFFEPLTQALLSFIRVQPAAAC